MVCSVCGAQCNDLTTCAICGAPVSAAAGNPPAPDGWKPPPFKPSPPRKPHCPQICPTCSTTTTGTVCHACGDPLPPAPICQVHQINQPNTEKKIRIGLLVFCGVFFLGLILVCAAIILFVEPDASVSTNDWVTIASPADILLEQDNLESKDPSASKSEKPNILIDAVSQKEFDQIKIGMTFDEISEIIGGYGLIIKAKDSDNFIAYWPGETDTQAQLNVIFQNGKAVTFEQTGFTED